MSAVSAPVKTSRPIAVGTMIDRLWELREEKRKLEAAAAKISETMSELETALDEKMTAEGVAKATGRNACVSFTTSVAATVDGEDGWDKAFPWIAKHKMWQLLRKQLNDTSYRELLESGKKVPGMQPFVKKRLNLRALP